MGPNTDGIDWEKDQQELEDALDTLERLGLGPNAPTTAPTTDAASQAGDSDPSEDEDLISDEELEMLARSDPDLAKLLRSNSLGRGFEELVGGEAGGDDDVAYDGEEEGEGAELADLFDALDEVRHTHRHRHTHRDTHAHAAMHTCSRISVPLPFPQPQAGHLHVWVRPLVVVPMCTHQ